MLHSGRFNSILTGDLDALPPLPSNTLKVFICANPEEFDTERKLLWKEILPDLQQHCMQYGVDVIFVDMLLGNRMDSTCSADDLSLRLEEIDRSFKDSIGPFFLALIGEQYGAVPLPTTLDEVEFLNICETAKDLGKDVKLLEGLYRRDDNAIPPVFSLSAEFEKQRLTHTNWLTTYTDVLQMIQMASKTVVSKDTSRFYISGLENQVKQAMSLCPDKCVFVFKSSKHSEDKCNNAYQNGGVQKVNSELCINPPCQTGTKHELPVKQNSGRVTTYMINSISEKSTDKLAQLKNMILEKVSSEHIIQFAVDGKSKRHLDDYYEDCVVGLARMLFNSFEIFYTGDVKNQNTSRDAFDYDETLVHLHRCVELYRESTPGFESCLGKIQSLLINGSRADHQLIIVKGGEGSGKSTVIARSCIRVRQLFGNDTVVIPIFVGLTYRTCCMQDIFRKICAQINLLFSHDVNIDSYSLRKLTNYFHGLMNRVSKNSRHVCVFIDGLEQTEKTPDMNLDSIDWLVTKLPPKFNIVVSCKSAERANIMARLESKLLNTDVIVYIGKQSTDTCVQMLNQTLSKNRRRLTTEQNETAIRAIRKEQCPVVVKAISKLVKTWTSNYSLNPPNDQKVQMLPDTLEALVSMIVSQLEDILGKKVTRILCAYITFARYGLSETELLDVLSASDEVLLSMLKNNCQDIFRFPPHAWASAQRLLGPILWKRVMAGKTLFSWANKTCAMAVRDRCLGKIEDELRVHLDLSSIYLEDWNTNNPFQKPDDTDITTEQVDRLLYPQPLVYNEVTYNVRKLQELWYHLLKSGDMCKFKKHTFCNFEYLLALADCDGVNKLKYYLDVVQSLIVDEDMHVLHLTLDTYGDTSHASPIQLANELIGRMRSIKDLFPDYIEPLVTQSMEWCDSYTLPLLVPLTTWLENVHDPYVTSFTHPEVISSAALMPNGQHVLIAAETSVHMYHIATKRLMKSFTRHTSNVTSIYLNPRTWTLFSTTKDKTLFVWDINTETCLQTFSDFKTYVTCLICYDDDQLICGTQDGSIIVMMIEDGHIAKTLVMHNKAVTALRLSKANAILISSSLDSKIVLWFTGDWGQMNVIEGEPLKRVTTIDVSQDGTFLIAGCDNGSLHVIAMATGTIAQTIQGHTGFVKTVSLCRDCHHCIAATSDGNVYLYNFRTTEVLDVYKRHKTELVAALLSENEQLAVTVSKDDVIVWSLLKRFTRETYQDIHSGPVSCLAITNDKKKLISGSMDGLLKSWNLDISDFSENFLGHVGPVTCLALASDNSFCISGSTDATVKVWSLSTATVLTNYKGHEQEINGAHVLSDNRLILSMDISQKIHMWRAEDGQTIRLYAGPTHISEVAPNCQRCISGIGDNRLQIWKLSDGSVIKEINHSDKITRVLCSRDSQYLVTGSADKSVKVWELETGKIVQIVVDFKSPVRSLAITDDNQTILSAGDEGPIYVCSTSLGIAERKLNGHSTTVTSLKLTVDDAILISGSLDHTIRVWNFRRPGNQLTVFDTHYPVLNFVLTENANRIAVQLSENHNVPILCLHNTPSKSKPAVTIESVMMASFTSPGSSTRFDSTGGSQVDLSEVSSEGVHVLPIKPKMTPRPRVSIVFQPTTRKRRCSSLSSIPQIIQHSPIRAPVQSTIMAQEKKRIRFPLKKKNPNKPNNKSEPVEAKRSNICTLF